VRARPRPEVMRPIVGAVLLAPVLVLVWVAVPGVVLVPVLLLGITAEVILYAVLYVAQRRSHW